MIDEKKLIEQLKGYKSEWKLAEPFHEGIASGLQIAIEATEKQPKVGEWIPFKEKEADEEEREVYGCDMILIGELPEEDEDILVTYASGKVDSDAFLREGYECYLDSGAQFISEAIAWMPLPEPYKEKE